MTFEIVGEVDKERLFCSGSFTKLLTTFVTLKYLAEKYDLDSILDDLTFLESLAENPLANRWVSIFQKILGAPFSLRDVCSYYVGLPYTFDVSFEELKKVDEGFLFKHHSIIEENLLLEMCEQCITPVYRPRQKFHYSELAIIFMGYLIEKCYNLSIENLYARYVIKNFNLISSVFSRKITTNLYFQDLSDRYDYPSIAILDHGYFCYSNGFFTTLKDMQKLLENLIHDPIFHYMTDIRYARAASSTIMNGLTVEIRKVADDILWGYEGLSFSGCNIWAYSTKYKKGYLTYTNDEEEAYSIYERFGYSHFDKAPEHTHNIYQTFLRDANIISVKKDIPLEFQGKYHRVQINEKNLLLTFEVGKDFIIIRNPDEVRYDLIYAADNNYRIKGKDNLPGAKVGFVTSAQGNHYMYHDGTLYQKIFYSESLEDTTSDGGVENLLTI